MKVAVVNNGVPFLRGGAELLAGALVEHLQRRGHLAVSIAVPFRWDTPDAILDSAFACFALRVPAVDRIIALKFPAFYIPHDDKVVWLLHQFRQVYDLWGTTLGDVQNNATGRRLRDAIHSADRRVLAPLRIYTNSKVTSTRLRRYNGIESKVLFPPLHDDSYFRNESFGDYLFYPSRINAAKRQLLAIEAMAYVRTKVKLVIAGAVEEPLSEHDVQALIERCGVSDRVRYIPGFMDEREKARLFANALGSVYIPFDEDSYGYVTLEAYASRKPVVTATDSGGTSVVCFDGETGYVVPPNPQALATAFDALHSDRRNAADMGNEGHLRVKQLGITWDHVVSALTS